MPAVLAALAVLLAVPPPAAAQAERVGIRPTGIRILAGLVNPENADKAFGLGGVLDLGTVATPWLHLSAGVSRWSTDIDRSSLASDVSGTVRDVRIHADVTANLFDLSGVRPYAGLGIALHSIGADIPGDPSLEEALQGTNTGAEILIGAASSAGTFRLSSEVRRELVDNVDNWSFLVGIGLSWEEKAAKP